MTFKQTVNQCFIYLAAFFLFLTIPPYFIWHTGSLKLVPILLLVIVSLIVCKGVSKQNISFALVFALLYFYFATRDGKNIIGIFSSLLVCFIFAFKQRYLCDVFKCFCNVYSLFMVPSLICYIYVVLLGGTMPYEIIEPENPLKDYSFFKYPCLIVADKLSFNQFRFCSYFDEPGVVGTISGILLLINGINTNKWQTWVVLLSGVFSLSLAFFLLLLVNILLFQPYKTKLLISIIFIVLFFLLYSNEVVQELLLNRFIFEDGQMSGINRTTSSMEFFMKSFWTSEKLLFGYGHNYAQNVVNAGGASYQDLIINYGIFGFAIFAILSFLFAFKYLKSIKAILVFACIWGSTIYQRPFIFAAIYFYLIFISFYVLPDKNVK